MLVRKPIKTLLDRAAVAKREKPKRKRTNTKVVGRVDVKAVNRS